MTNILPLPQGPFAVYNAAAGQFLPVMAHNVSDARRMIIDHLDLSQPNEIVRHGSSRFHELQKPTRQTTR